MLYLAFCFIDMQAHRIYDQLLKMIEPLAGREILEINLIVIKVEINSEITLRANLLQRCLR